MAKLTTQEAAIMRMAMHDEARALHGNMQNTSPNIGAEYPRMMYRATDEEARSEQTDEHSKCGVTYLVVNRYNGLLCDTMVATSADDAETLTADGWETTPEAAHGLKPGLAAAATAKDVRIAELEALVAGMASNIVEDEIADRPRRGRPPKLRDELLTGGAEVL